MNNHTVAADDTKGIWQVFFFFFYNNLFLAVLGLCYCESFSLVVARGDDSLVVMHGLLTEGASPVGEHSL